jgi:hypothetical protein
MMSSTSKARKPSNPPRATSGSTHQDIPPDSPSQVLSANTITSEHVQQFLDILKQANQATSGPTSGADPSVEKHDEKKDRVRASKIDFKTVNQMYAPCSQNESPSLINFHSYNKSTYKYEIKESYQASSDEDEFEEYIFIHRRKLGKFLITQSPLGCSRLSRQQESP